MDDIYYNSSVILSRKVPCRIISWITMLIISLIFLITFGLIFKYDKYEQYSGIYIDNQIHLYVEKEKITTLKGKFILDSKEYNFKINSISNDYAINEGKNYYEVIVECELDNKYKINNNILDINMQLEKTTLMQEILNFFKKGLM